LYLKDEKEMALTKTIKTGNQNSIISKKVIKMKTNSSG